MSLMKWWISIVVVSIGWVTVANGQMSVPGPRFAPKGVEGVENTRPLAEPGVFDYDGKMFAPVEFSTFEELKPNSGIYMSVDRTYYSVSRGGPRDVLPTTVLESDYPVGNDYMWGNRFEVGTMTDEGSGWGVVYEKTSGVGFAWGQDYTISTPFMINTTLSSVEINRMFRQALSSGGYVDPYFGMRYLNVSDRTLEDTTGFGSNRFKQNASNSAFGGQVGGRYNMNRGRFRYTFDGAVAATYNQQRYFATDILFAGATIGVSERNQTAQSFVPLIDGRMEVSYLLTRDIGLRFGAQVMHMWDGIARSDNLTTALNPNSINSIGVGTAGIFNESTTAAGFSFGLSFNR